MMAVKECESVRADGNREYFPPIATHLIRSRIANQTFEVQVMQPLRQTGDASRYPVVYATDGNMLFDVLKGISCCMQMSESEVPRFILVGIGYPSASPFAGLMLRTRDLTFPRYPKLSTKPPPIEGVLVAEEGAKDFYGAEDFQKFIAEELVTFVDEKYPTITNDRTYFGHSVGAGFGLFTLFTRPELFRRYILSSPGLIYHGKSSAGVDYSNYDFLLQEARKFIASGESLNGVRAYMSVGTEEEFEREHVQWQLTSSFYRMAALLKAAKIPGLGLTTEVLPGEVHATVWPMSFVHGVQAVFGASA